MVLAKYKQNNCKYQKRKKKLTNFSFAEIPLDFLTTLSVGRAYGPKTIKSNLILDGFQLRKYKLVKL